MAQQKYFKCDSCNKVVETSFFTMKMSCLCQKSHGFLMAMREITQAEFLKGGAQPRRPPQVPKPSTVKCCDCGCDIPQKQPKHWGFNASTQRCDKCDVAYIQLLMKKYQQAQQAQVARMHQAIFNSGLGPLGPLGSLTRRVTWYCCRGCGDLLSPDELKPLHLCPSDDVQRPILVAVEFEEKELSMTPVTNVRVWWDASVSAYRLTSPYSKDLVEGLKQHIPVSDRSFDHTTKIWTFVEKQFAPIQAMFKLMGIQATVITRAQAEQASQSTPTGPRKNTAIAEVALEFIRVAGADAMLKAYRAAALTHHPDKGGSMDAMSSLNAAWERIQREIYKIGVS